MTVLGKLHQIQGRVAMQIADLEDLRRLVQDVWPDTPAYDRERGALLAPLVDARERLDALQRAGIEAIHRERA